MLASCNECRWYKHRANWKSRCVYLEPSGVQRSWLEAASTSPSPFGLRCRCCFEYYGEAKDSMGSPYITGVKGRMKHLGCMSRQFCLFLSRVTSAAATEACNGKSILRPGAKKATLQVCDLLDHSSSPQHLAAVASRGSETTEKHGNGQVDGKSDTTPTIAQLLLSQEILSNPLSAQGAEYTRRNLLGSRSDRENFPFARSEAGQHFKNVQAMAAVLFEEDRESFKRPGFRCLSVAEDVCGSLKIIRFRGVTTDFGVRTRLLDVAESTSKIALHKKEQLEASIWEFCDRSPELVDTFKKSVQAGHRHRLRPPNLSTFPWFNLRVGVLDGRVDSEGP